MMSDIVDSVVFSQLVIEGYTSIVQFQTHRNHSGWILLLNPYSTDTPVY